MTNHYLQVKNYIYINCSLININLFFNSKMANKHFQYKTYTNAYCFIRNYFINIKYDHEWKKKILCFHSKWFHNIILNIQDIPDNANKRYSPKIGFTLDSDVLTDRFGISMFSCGFSKDDRWESKDVFVKRRWLEHEWYLYNNIHDSLRHIHDD